MSTAIIALSKKAVELALTIKNLCDQATVYTMPKHTCGDTVLINCDFNTFIGKVFNEYKTLIFIMSTGIVVRCIAPYLKHKSMDPAVLVLDSKGNYVISLLSGHLGGANKKAISLAKKLNAEAIITTASDLDNKVAVDLFAKSNNLLIANFDDAKIVTANIVNDEYIGLITEFPLQVFSTSANVIDTMEYESKFTGIIYVTNKNNIPDFPVPVAKLIKPNIALGIGCKRGIAKQLLADKVLECLTKLNIDIRAVKTIASVDIKADELAIIGLAQKLNAEFITYTVEQLKEVEHRFEVSEFVKKIIGVGAVAEPSGFLASKKGECLLKKQKLTGITVSVWQER